MSSNPIIELAQVTGLIDMFQLAIADLDRRMDAATLAESTEDQSALRFTLAAYKAELGQLRNSESFWRQEINDMKEARKSQGDLGKA